VQLGTLREGGEEAEDEETEEEEAGVGEGAGDRAPGEGGEVNAELALAGW
jgi:hypothetical protein